MMYTVPKAGDSIDTDYFKVPRFFWSPKMMDLDPIEFKIVHFFVKNTYGFKQPIYSIGVDQLAEECSLNRKTVSKYMNTLLGKGFLTIERQSSAQSGITRAYSLIYGSLTVHES